MFVPHRFRDLPTRAGASIRHAALSALPGYFISPSRTGRTRRPHATHRGATQGAEEELRSTAKPIAPDTVAKTADGAYVRSQNRYKDHYLCQFQSPFGIEAPWN